MVNTRKDIVRKAEGEAKTVIPTNGLTERKFSLTQTTDKMGVTTGGKIARGFLWGAVIGAGIIVGIGMWKNKINISYTK